MQYKVIFVFNCTLARRLCPVFLCWRNKFASTCSGLSYIARKLETVVDLSCLLCSIGLHLSYMQNLKLQGPGLFL